MITLLITGVGGPLGQALIKAGQASSIPCRLIGTDCSPLSVGLQWVEAGYVMPKAADREEYICAVKEINAKERIDLILPGSDSELVLLSEHAAELRAASGAVVVASPPDILRIAMDKFQTCEFLKAARLNYPRFSPLDGNGAVSALVDDCGFPLIAKPIRGSGSRGLCKIHSWADIQYLTGLGAEMVVQEYLKPDDQEYTVAVYQQRSGVTVGSICLKRELVAGNTYRAWVDQNEVIQAEAEAVVRALGPFGPCNVQLRLTARGAVAFEINPRFSGTTAMRAHFGYNEVEMAIRDLVLNEPVPVPKLKPGIAMRFWDERYFSPEGAPESSALHP